MADTSIRCHRLIIERLSAQEVQITALDRRHRVVGRFVVCGETNPVWFGTAEEHASNVVPAAPPEREPDIYADLGDGR